MRKPNLIIGKKQIILASLTLVLGIAVYMNYVFAEVGNDIAADAEIQSAADTQVITAMRHLSVRTAPTLRSLPQRELPTISLRHAFPE